VGNLLAVGSVVELLKWHHIFYLMVVNRRRRAAKSVQLQGCRLAVGVSNSGSGKGFSFPQNAQTNSGPYSASYSEGDGVLSRR